MLETFLLSSGLEKSTRQSLSHGVEEHVQRFMEDIACTRTGANVCGPLTTLCIKQVTFSNCLYLKINLLNYRCKMVNCQKIWIHSIHLKQDYGFST